jgi:Flp pilus assembly protein TadD
MNRTLATAVLVLAACLALPVAHADGDSSPALAGVPADADAEAGKAAIRAQNWKGAIDSFTKVAARDARNADAQNWLGFAYRKLGNLDLAFKHYNEALRLEPRHRGAHEYIGEAYLMKDDLAKAKEHLAALDRLCFFGCEEYTDLKNAIAAYEKRGK